MYLLPKTLIEVCGLKSHTS